MTPITSGKIQARGRSPLLCSTSSSQTTSRHLQKSRQSIGGHHQWRRKWRPGLESLPNAYLHGCTRHISDSRYVVSVPPDQAADKLLHYSHLGSHVFAWSFGPQSDAGTDATVTTRWKFFLSLLAEFYTEQVGADLTDQEALVCSVDLTGAPQSGSLISPKWPSWMGYLCTHDLSYIQQRTSTNFDLGSSERVTITSVQCQFSPMPSVFLGHHLIAAKYKGCGKNKKWVSFWLNIPYEHDSTSTFPC